MVNYSKWDSVCDSDEEEARLDIVLLCFLFPLRCRPQDAPEPSVALREARSLRIDANNIFEVDPEAAGKRYKQALRALRSTTREPEVCNIIPTKVIHSIRSLEAREEEHRVLLNLAAVSHKLERPDEVDNGETNSQSHQDSSMNHLCIRMAGAGVNPHVLHELNHRTIPNF